VVVPGPVAGDPSDVVSLWFLVGGQFLDGLRRLFDDHRTGDGIKNDRLGKGLVYDAAGQHVAAVLRVVLSSNARSGAFLLGDGRVRRVGGRLARSGIFL